MTDQPMVGLLAAALITFVALFLGEPIVLAFDGFSDCTL
jgi:hypothetical protein